MATTVQYEKADGLGLQLGVTDLHAEPFTVKQQRQSRMDGGEDEELNDLFRLVLPPIVSWMLMFMLNLDDVFE